jgi:hypothetical protein
MKEIKEVYMEKYKSLKKEIKEDTEDGRIAHVYGLTESILRKCPYY